MARLSLSSLTLLLSRAYNLVIHLFWIFLTYVAWTVIWPALQRANNLRFRDDITDLERLAYDISRSWYVPVLWLCIVLSVGCIVGFLPDYKLRTTCIRHLTSQMVFIFLGISIACDSSAGLLKSRGFEIIEEACQARKPTDLSETTSSQFDEFCRQTQLGARYIAIAVVAGCGLVGLNMITLTWIWYRCAAKEQTRLRELIEKEVSESAGPVKLTREETLDVGQKV